MRDWMIDYGSWCLAPFGLFGMYVAGLKKTWGWLVSMGTQALWATYAVGTGQYGFLIGTVSYFAVYLNNYLLWHTGRSGVDRLLRRPSLPPAVSPELRALRAVFADLDSTGRAGDEWAYEWVHEVWTRLVPADVRALAGDTDAIEDVQTGPAVGASGINWDDPVCSNCPHLRSQHDGEGCTVTIPQTEDPDFGPTQTCPCCAKGPR